MSQENNIQRVDSAENIIQEGESSVETTNANCSTNIDLLIKIKSKRKPIFKLTKRRDVGRKKATISSPKKEQSCLTTAALATLENHRVQSVNNLPPQLSLDREGDGSINNNPSLNNLEDDEFFSYNQNFFENQQIIHLMGKKWPAFNRGMNSNCPKKIITAENTLEEEENHLMSNELLSQSAFEMEDAPNNMPQTNFSPSSLKCGFLKEQTALSTQSSQYSRREKSLEELSKKFLTIFLQKEQMMISLDKITQQLDVERRRIYDIINILESLKLVTRRGKNNYKWNGFDQIFDTIQIFKNQSDDIGQSQAMMEMNEKKEKSLEILSIGFLKLFLNYKETLSLEEAARKLSPNNSENQKIKTKIRRLYDIANVFKSLGLIKKVQLNETKKPAFQWVGVSGLQEFYNSSFREPNDDQFEPENIPQQRASEQVGCSQVSQLLHPTDISFAPISSVPSPPFLLVRRPTENSDNKPANLLDDSSQGLKQSTAIDQDREKIKIPNSFLSSSKNSAFKRVNKTCCISNCLTPTKETLDLLLNLVSSQPMDPMEPMEPKEPNEPMNPMKPMEPMEGQTEYQEKVTSFSPKLNEELIYDDKEHSNLLEKMLHLTLAPEISEPLVTRILNPQNNQTQQVENASLKNCSASNALRWMMGPPELGLAREFEGNSGINKSTSNLVQNFNSKNSAFHLSKRKRIMDKGIGTTPRSEQTSPILDSPYILSQKYPQNLSLESVKLEQMDCTNEDENKSQDEKDSDTDHEEDEIPHRKGDCDDDNLNDMVERNNPMRICESHQKQKRIFKTQEKTCRKEEEKKIKESSQSLSVGRSILYEDIQGQFDFAEDEEKIFFSPNKTMLGIKKRKKTLQEEIVSTSASSNQSSDSKINQIPLRVEQISLPFPPLSL